MRFPFFSSLSSPVRRETRLADRRRRSAARTAAFTTGGRRTLALGGRLGPRMPLPVSESEPLPAAPAPDIPLGMTHLEDALRARTTATVRSARQRAIEEHTSFQIKIARLVSRRRRLQDELERAGAGYATASAARARFLENSAGGREDELAPRGGRIARAVPWVLFLADTLLMWTPWELYGAPTIPFVGTNARTQDSLASLFALGRAALVSFALVFTAKLLGSILASRNDGPPGRRRGRMDIVVVLAASVAAIALAAATSYLQKVFLAVQAGGTSTSVPTTTLFAVVGFMCVASFATGYWWSSPLAERFTGVDRHVKDARAAYTSAARDLEQNEASILALEARVDGLVRRLAELEEEQQSLTDEEVALWRWENWPLAGVGEPGRPAEPVRVERPLPSLAESLRDETRRMTNPSLPPPVSAIARDLGQPDARAAENNGAVVASDGSALSAREE